MFCKQFSQIESIRNLIGIRIQFNSEFMICESNSNFRFEFNIESESDLIQFNLFKSVQIKLNPNSNSNQFELIQI